MAFYPRQARDSATGVLHRWVGRSLFTEDQRAQILNQFGIDRLAGLGCMPQCHLRDAGATRWAASQEDTSGIPYSEASSRIMALARP